MSTDPIRESWLLCQEAAAAELNAASDIALITQLDRTHFLADLHCKGLVRLGGDTPFGGSHNGEIKEAEFFRVGIWFPEDYHRVFRPEKTIFLIEPRGAWHPNVFETGICAGRMTPGTDLVDLLDQIFSILTYKHMNLKDPLNPAAAQWARDQTHLFPIDRRPLRRSRSESEAIQA